MKNVINCQNVSELLKECNFTMGDVKKLYEYEIFERFLNASFTTSTIKWICKNYLIFNNFKSRYDKVLCR